MATGSKRKFAVVTGASSGIGFELARQFAEHDYDVLICAENDLSRASSQLRACGVDVIECQVNLAKYKGVERLCNVIRSSGRPVDAIAINAGVGVGGDFARQTDLDQELNLIRLNVTSTVHLAKRVLEDMIARGEGKVLFCSSIAASIAGSYEAVYAGSKAFIQNFAEAIREELKDTHITITSLMPGPTETNFFHRAGMDDTKVGSQKKDDPAVVARQGFEAMMKGKDHVVAGSIKNRLMATAAKILPMRVSAEAHRRLAEPGSAKKSKRKAA